MSASSETAGGSSRKPPTSSCSRSRIRAASTIRRTASREPGRGSAPRPTRRSAPVTRDMHELACRAIRQPVRWPLEGSIGIAVGGVSGVPLPQEREWPAIGKQQSAGSERDERCQIRGQGERALGRLGGREAVRQCRAVPGAARASPIARRSAGGIGGRRRARARPPGRDASSASRRAPRRAGRDPRLPARDAPPGVTRQCRRSSSVASAESYRASGGDGRALNVGTRFRSRPSRSSGRPSD